MKEVEESYIERLGSGLQELEGQCVGLKQAIHTTGPVVQVEEE